MPDEKKKEDDKKKSATMTLGQKLNRRILEITGASKVTDPLEEARLKRIKDEEEARKKKPQR